MTITARCKITQAATVTDGLSQSGNTAANVVFSNGDNTGGVDQWKFVLLDKPPASGLVLGIVQDFSGANTWTITAAQLVTGAKGSYFVEVWAKNSTTGEVRTSTVLYKDQPGSGAGGVFAVPGGVGNNRVFPPHGALNRHMNFGGELRGWTRQLHDWLADIVAGSAGNGSVTVASREAAANTAWVAGTDCVIYFTLTGLTGTLPAAPTNGQRFEAKADFAAGTLTISSAAINIELNPAAAALTDTLNAGQSRTYTYSLASNLWKRS